MVRPKASCVVRPKLDNGKGHSKISNSFVAISRIRQELDNGSSGAV